VDFRFWRHFSRIRLPWRRRTAAADAAAAEAEGVTGKKKKGRIRENIEVFLSAILIAVVIRVFLVDNYEIPTGSMIPNLLEGDRLFVTKFVYGVRLPVLPNWKLPAFTSPDRGDVVIFQYPLYRSPGALLELADLFTFAIFRLDPQPKNFVKRVIGLPGDRVRLNREGELFVNGQRLAREYQQEREVRAMPEAGNRLRMTILVDGKQIHEYTKSAFEPEDRSATYRLYKEAGRIVQYRVNSPTGNGSSRPFPPDPTEASLHPDQARWYYERLAENFLVRNMLQTEPGDETVAVVREAEGKREIEKGKDLHLLLFNDRGELWYRLRGMETLQPLFEYKDGALWIVVPPDHYFVMGDNRDNSSDSRYWGFVHKGFVMGTPLVRYWPFGRFGTVE
jgi:signal peptidase I